MKALTMLIIFWNVMIRTAVTFPNVSEELIASIFRVRAASSAAGCLTFFLFDSEN
jgi:hypothetical protein